MTLSPACPSVTPRKLLAFLLGLTLGLALAAGRAEGQAPGHALPTDTIRATAATPYDTMSLASLRRVLDSLGRVEDSLVRRRDSLLSPRPYIAAATAAAYRRAFHPGRFYAGTLAAGLAVNWTCPAGLCDRDPGGYPDSWRTFDKVEHFQIAYFLSDRALDMGVQRRWAVTLTCAAAIGWEGTQAKGGGFASWRDASASCAGAALPAVIRWLRSHNEPESVR